MIERFVTSILLGLSALSHIRKLIVDKHWRSLKIPTYHDTIAYSLLIARGEKSITLVIRGTHAIFLIYPRVRQYMELYC